MSKFYLKDKDTRPILQVALKNPDGTAHNVNASDNEVWLHIKLKGTTTVLSRQMEIETPSGGNVVRYEPDESDWADPNPLVVGEHPMEYEVLGPAGARLTFPNAGHDTLVITDDLGQAAALT